MAVRQCFFFDTPEVTKIVLPKVLQNFKLYLLAQGTEPNFFSFFPRIRQYRVRLKSTLSIFFGIARPFSKNIFGGCRREYTLKSFSYF